MHGKLPTKKALLVVSTELIFYIQPCKRQNWTLKAMNCFFFNYGSKSVWKTVLFEFDIKGLFRGSDPTQTLDLQVRISPQIILEKYWGMSNNWEKKSHGHCAFSKSCRKLHFFKIKNLLYKSGWAHVSNHERQSHANLNTNSFSKCYTSPKLQQK